MTINLLRNIRQLTSKILESQIFPADKLRGISTTIMDNEYNWTVQKTKKEQKIPTHSHKQARKDLRQKNGRNASQLNSIR